MKNPTNNFFSIIKDPNIYQATNLIGSFFIAVATAITIGVLLNNILGAIIIMLLPIVGIAAGVWIYKLKKVLPGLRDHVLALANTAFDGYGKHAFIACLIALAIVILTSNTVLMVLGFYVPAFVFGKIMYTQAKGE